MKNYELIMELLTYPAGSDIVFNSNVGPDDMLPFNDGKTLVEKEVKCTKLSGNVVF